MTAKKSARGSLARPLHGASVVAFSATQRPQASLAFYRDTLGLEMEYQDQFALVFDCGGTTLRVAVVPKVKPAGYTILGWQVEDIDRTIAELEAAGVKFTRFPGMGQAENGVWNSPSGARVAWFNDPDGNTLSLTQL